jgi:hypothetical protein
MKNFVQLCRYLVGGENGLCDKPATWIVHNPISSGMPVCDEHVTHYQEDPKQTGESRKGRIRDFDKTRYLIKKI